LSCHVIRRKRVLIAIVSCSPSDVNKSKAEAAAKFVMKRVPSTNITFHHNDIKDKPEEFYRQFTVCV
jgi:molybdopterin/thiamine biosynthesis adenylyltransferase